MVLIIKLYEFFNSNIIITRRIMAYFFDYLSKQYEEEIVLDFSNIDFISRSCADEYIKRRLNSKKKIKEINMNIEVLSIFKLANKQFQRELGMGIPA